MYGIEGHIFQYESSLVLILFELRGCFCVFVRARVCMCVCLCTYIYIYLCMFLFFIFCIDITVHIQTFLLVIIPIIMEKLEKYHFMKVSHVMGQVSNIFDCVWLTYLQCKILERIS